MKGYLERYIDIRLLGSVLGVQHLVVVVCLVLPFGILTVTRACCQSLHGSGGNPYIIPVVSIFFSIIPVLSLY